MLSGRKAHYNKNRKLMLKDICEKPVEMKPYFSEDACSVLQGLLQINASKRLGSGQTGDQDIINHPFFKEINWSDLRAKRIPPPFKPTVSGAEDTRNIDKLFTSEAV